MLVYLVSCGSKNLIIRKYVYVYVEPDKKVKYSPPRSKVKLIFSMDRVFISDDEETPLNVSQSAVIVLFFFTSINHESNLT